MADFQTRRRFLKTAAAAAAAAAAPWACVVPLRRSGGPLPIRIPVIHCTDLFHPPDDPDDHFDLATLYSLPEIDLQGIVLDQGTKQVLRPGRIPVSQMNRLTGRQVPAAVGLADPLTSPSDKALGQDPRFQEGVELILDVLRRSPDPVTIITVGSVRDVVAAFNREPVLFRRKLARLMAFIGEASREDFQEYNVGLDPQAYVGLMRLGLPLDWVPCFDGGNWNNFGHGSFWKTGQEALLSRAPDGLVQYFIYALDQETSDPLDFLAVPVDPARRARIFGLERNLWGTAIFASAAGRIAAFDGQRYVLPPAGTPSGEQPILDSLFGFEAVDVSITDGGIVRYGGMETRPVRRFVVRDPDRYAEGMTRVTAELLAGFGSAPPFTSSRGSASGDPAEATPRGRR